MIPLYFGLEETSADRPFGSVDDAVARAFALGADRRLRRVGDQPRNYMWAVAPLNPMGDAS